MKRCMPRVTVFAALLLALLAPGPARAIDEPERLWLVGERAAADGLHALAQRALDRLLAQYPSHPRAPEATLLLARARLALGELEPALEGFRQAQAYQPVPGRPLEARFWEAESLFRLKRYAEARTVYDDVVRRDAASPLAADALYGYAWSELELGRPEAAATAFQDLLTTWPEHAVAPAAMYTLGRALVELKRHSEARAQLEAFLAKYPGHRLAPDARYLLAVAQVNAGDVRGGIAGLRSFVAQYPSHEMAPAATRLIGQTLTSQGDRGELEALYRATMAEERPTPEALWDAAAVAGRLGRASEQEAAWRKLRQDHPDHPLAQRASLELGHLAFKRQDWKGAVWLAHLAGRSEEAPVRGEAWLLAGESELKLKRFDAAEKAFETVGEVKDVEAGVRYRALAGLGLAREEQREWKGALEAYEVVATRSPDTTLRAWARERAAAVKSRLARPTERPAPPRKKGGA